MKCTKCGAAISTGDEREHNGEPLCEDCYIDVLSPARFCDPWADYAAKSHMDNNPETILNANQALIVKVIEEKGEVDPLTLMDILRDEISPEDGERECAALNRMGKIAIENQDGAVCIRLK